MTYVRLIDCGRKKPEVETQGKKCKERGGNEVGRGGGGMMLASVPWLDLGSRMGRLPEGLDIFCFYFFGLV